MPAAAQTMSTMASTAPTSWKWIFSMSTLWILASEAPRSSKVWIAVALTAGGEVGGVDEFADVGEGAAVGVGVLVVVVFFVGVGLAGFVEVLGLGVGMVGVVFGGALVLKVIRVGVGWVVDVRIFG